jgi:hypothetical protein
VTYNPPTLQALGSYWVAQGGVNLGVVGDTTHIAKGTSYHLGKDDLIAGAYSARLPRDLAGLTNAASAIDLGRLDGELTKLWAFSRWFAQQCFDRDPAYRDIREVIFWSVVRQRVIGWSALAPGEWINDYGDISHKTHTHISFFRDSEFRDKRPMFRPYFETAQPAPGGSDMPVFKAFATPKVVTVPTGGWLYVKPDLSADPSNIQIDPGRDLPVAGKLSDGTLIVGYRDTTPTELEVPTFYAKGTPKDYPAPAATDCAAQVAAAVDPLNATISGLRTDLANAQLTGARAEWDRQNAGATVAVRLLDKP